MHILYARSNKALYTHSLDYQVHLTSLRVTQLNITALQFILSRFLITYKYSPDSKVLSKHSLNLISPPTPLQVHTFIELVWMKCDWSVSVSYPSIVVTKRFYNDVYVTVLMKCHEINLENFYYNIMPEQLYSGNNGSPMLSLFCSNVMCNAGALHYFLIIVIIFISA